MLKKGFTKIDDDVLLIFNLLFVKIKKFFQKLFISFEIVEQKKFNGLLEYN